MCKWLSYPGNKQIDISRKSGVSKQLVNKVLEQKGKKDFTFSNVLRIIRSIDSDFDNTMEEYCRSQTKPSGILNALEYASNFRKYELLDDLIAENRDQKGEIKDWVQIYRLSRDFKEYSYNEAIQKCRELYGRVSLPEAKLKLELIEFDIKYSLFQSDIKFYISSFEEKIKTLRSGFLKDSLEIRYKLFKSFVSLYEYSDIEHSIKLANEIICSPLSASYIIGSAFHIKGQAYMFTDLKESIDCLDNAMLYYAQTDKVKAESIKEDIYFTLNANGQLIDLEELQGEELIHQLIVRKDYETARLLLKTTNSPFDYLFKGIVENDLSLIFESYGMLRSSGQLFFANYIRSVYDKLNFEKVVED
nr:AimR family lysis-lysogeny pheromone receptor [Shouchella lehensis]